VVWRTKGGVDIGVVEVINSVNLRKTHSNVEGPAVPANAPNAAHTYFKAKWVKPSSCVRFLAAAPVTQAT
jgi:hypothetical protein